MVVSLKGTDCLQKSFDSILIVSDKAAFMSAAALFTVITVETAVSAALTAPPAGRESDCIFNHEPSPATLQRLLLTLLTVFCSNSAHLFQSIRITRFFNVFIFKEASSFHQACIDLTINTAKAVIL